MVRSLSYELNTDTEHELTQETNMSANKQSVLTAFNEDSKQKAAAAAAGAAAGAVAAAPIPYEELFKYLGHDKTVYDASLKANLKKLLKEALSALECTIIYGQFDSSANTQASILSLESFETHILYDAKHREELRKIVDSCVDEAHNLADIEETEVGYQKAVKLYGEGARKFLNDLHAVGDLPDDIGDDPNTCLEFLKGTIGNFLAKAYKKSVEEVMKTFPLFDQFQQAKKQAINPN